MIQDEIKQVWQGHIAAYQANRKGTSDGLSRVKGPLGPANYRYFARQFHLQYVHAELTAAKQMIDII
ncbi:hypothetical protein EHS13_23555 [Paenibacillus psychroresistens]|uniref:Uncharacterized protein n=1 Tax=Paenibacillus psychroresistens TaxID=1778678 RepID=A0A6B8RPM7_9BACL|nr:hypothetical protein [Paenibacillus psychroresistens]QGQ97652.1 hypothetical protein EHS13_23555 [Paenibacillus psychroresistens]